MPEEVAPRKAPYTINQLDKQQVCQADFKHHVGD